MKLIKEHINFERGQNPIKAMDIGKTSKYFYDNLEVGDIYRLKKDIPDFWYHKGMIMLITRIVTEDEPTDYTTVVCTRGDYNLEDVKKSATAWIKANTGERWGWPYHFFIEYLEKVYHVDVNESVNFERGKDPMSAMNIGNSAELWWANLKEGDCFKLIKDLPSLGYKKGMHVYITRYLGVRTDNDDRKERKMLYCDKYNSLEDFKKDINKIGGSGLEWRWTLEFMKEYFVKVII